MKQKIGDPLDIKNPPEIIHYMMYKFPRDIISYLNIIYNSHDDLSLLRCINTPKRGIGNKTIENLINKANETGQSIYDVIDSGKEQGFKNIISLQLNY